MPIIDGVVTLLPAPEGYVVNFAHPQREADIQTYWVAGFGNVFALAFLIQRLYTKVVLSKGLQLDDAFIILSWLASVATQFLVVYMFAKGVGGVHGWEISIDQFNTWMLVVWVASWIYVLCGSFAKLSLLVFFFRLSPIRWFRISVWITTGIVAAYSIGIFFSLIFACTPIRKNFDITVTEGSCINAPALYIATAAANIATDVILLILPVPMVLALQMSTPHKIGVLIVFTIGSATVVTSIIRCAILPGMLTSLDQTWAISFASLWIVVEANLLVMCACMPTLRKFFRHVAPKLMGESRYGSQSNTNGASKSGKPSAYANSASHNGRRRDQYAKFSDDVELYPTGTSSPNETYKTEVDGGRRDGSLRWDSRKGESDGESQKAIVQTTTVSVRYD